MRVYLVAFNDSLTNLILNLFKGNFRFNGLVEILFKPGQKVELKGITDYWVRIGLVGVLGAKGPLLPLLFVR